MKKMIPQLPSGNFPEMDPFILAYNISLLPLLSVHASTFGNMMNNILPIEMPFNAKKCPKMPFPRANSNIRALALQTAEMQLFPTLSTFPNIFPFNATPSSFYRLP